LAARKCFLQTNVRLTTSNVVPKQLCVPIPGVFMRIEYTPEQNALRQELRDSFAPLVTPEYRAELSVGEGGGPLYHKVLKQLGKDGWLGIGWPKEYGGQDRSKIEQFIFFDEAMYSGVMLPTLTINAVAPTIMQLGTDEQ